MYLCKYFECILKLYLNKKTALFMSVCIFVQKNVMQMCSDLQAAAWLCENAFGLSSVLRFRN